MSINYGYGDHTHSISNPWRDAVVNTPGLVMPTTPKPKETTAARVAKERREARERAKLELAYAAWDELELDQLPERSVLMFDVDHHRGHLYTYVALKVDERWFLTGSKLNGGSTEDFLAWLIQCGVEPGDVDILEARDE